MREQSAQHKIGDSMSIGLKIFTVLMVALMASAVALEFGGFKTEGIWAIVAIAILSFMLDQGWRDK
jgi:hypothetical protein